MRANVTRQQLCFLRQAVIGQVAANEKDIGLTRNLREELLHLALRMLAVMNIGSCCDAHAIENGLTWCRGRVRSVVRLRRLRDERDRDAAEDDGGILSPHDRDTARSG